MTRSMAELNNSHLQVPIGSLSKLLQQVGGEMRYSQGLKPNIEMIHALLHIVAQLGDTCPLI